MKTIKIVLIFILYLAVYQSFGQSSGNYNYNQPRNTSAKGFNNIGNDLGRDSVLIVSAQVLLNAQPDALVAIFNLTQVGETATQTFEILKGRISNFKKDAVKIGIDTAAIHIDMVSQVPVYEYEIEKKLFSKTYNEMPKGFELQQNLHIPLADEKQLEHLIQVANRYEIYEFVKINYALSNKSVLLDTIRQQAARIVEKKLKLLARIGIKTNSLYQTATEKIEIIEPSERYSTYQAFQSANLEKTKTNSNINNLRKPTVRYYSPAEAKEADVVINPNVVAPAIQILYQLNIKYMLKKQ